MQKEVLTLRKKESYQIFNDIADTYDSLNHTLSMGIDLYWRKKLSRSLPAGPVKILDLATGTGDLAITMAKARPLASIRGLDMSEGMIKKGLEKIKKADLEKRVVLEIGDGVHLPTADASYDYITISFGIRNFPDPLTSLINCHRTLVPGGKILVLEFSMPKNFLVKHVYNFYFRHVLPRVGNWFSGHGDAYTYLNKTVEDFPYGKSFLDLMATARFKNLKATPLTFGIATLYEGQR